MKGWVLFQLDGEEFAMLTKIIRINFTATDILAAFEAAISDGVDVLSVSLGGSNVEFLESGISVGSFHAIAKGIVVVASSGNSGPTPSGASNLEPWMITVGASTMDRSFTSYVTLGSKKILKYSLPPHKFYPLISAVDAKAVDASSANALLCKNGTLDPKKAKGKIVVCLRGDNDRTDKGVQAAHVGAVARHHSTGSRYSCCF
ncbi:hypothetical protein TSUD_184720 [Trifolium subterraneum]|uniref:Peptidase S8/S53 domain-containing protein n=1 Tax=Trifolium subterraneum TaxID=3900 RepID=A0A2Z6NLW8_TRISU|nr:hypothetical protein TSUD_184720 [Trifolium subterraneum]